MKWTKIKEQLPPRNTLVWVRRLPNEIETQPIYLAMRNNLELSENPDASVDCHWYGIHNSDLRKSQTTNTNFSFNASFSDVTVDEWAFIGY